MHSSHFYKTTLAINGEGSRPRSSNALLARGERIINETSTDSRHASRSSSSSSSVFMTLAKYLAAFPVRELSRCMRRNKSNNRNTIFRRWARRDGRHGAVCRKIHSREMAGGCAYADLPSASLAGGVINSIRLFADTPLRVASDGFTKDTPPQTSSEDASRRVHTCTQCVDDGFRWRYAHVRYFFIPLTATQAGYRIRCLRFLLRSIIIPTSAKHDENLWCRAVILIFLRKKEGNSRVHEVFVKRIFLRHLC